MGGWDVSYEEELVEFIQDLFPRRVVVSAIMRATIERQNLILPEIYVHFDRYPPRAEQVISDHIDSFIEIMATQEGATYSKTMRRIIVEDTEDTDGLLRKWDDEWY